MKHHPATEPIPQVKAFEALRFGLSIHFGTGTFTDQELDQGNAPASVYNPTKLNVRQWVELAHGIGMTYGLLTAKHVSGFCLWPAEDEPYSVKHSSNTTDVVAEYIAACEELGIKPGIYYCILDARNEGKLDWGSLVARPYYEKIKRHVTELHTRYPQTFYQHFDIPNKLTSDQRWELYELVKSLNPTCLVSMNQMLEQSRSNRGRVCEAHAWPTDVINGERSSPPRGGHNPRMTIEGREHYLPMEAWDISSSTWFWNTRYRTIPGSALYALHQMITSRNANLLLNLAPDNTGMIAQEAVEQLKLLRRFIDGDAK